ncbi:hypothetical protein MBLNU459_g5263t1 [Dothideomycetes sp. NU459]
MDGFSGAASVIAVVALAVNSTTKIHRFLETIKNAPEDLLSLKECVGQLHRLLEGVRLVAEGRDYQARTLPCQDYLLEAVQVCEIKLRRLELEVSKLRDKVEQKGIRRVSKALGITVTKETIAKARNQVQEATHFLNIALGLTNIVFW